VSLIEKTPVRPLRKIDIEYLSLKYLAEEYPEVLDHPAVLDIDHLLSNSLSKTHDFRLQLVSELDNPAFEGEMRVNDRVIRLPEKCYLGICEGDGRSRFTGAHEASHVILHYEQFKALAANPARTKLEKVPVYRDPEWQADHGGGALLMPLVTAYPFLLDLQKANADADDIKYEFCKTFGVSRIAAGIRVEKISQPDLVGLAELLLAKLGGSK
jgi:IrrE N-terminal-like domain